MKEYLDVQKKIISEGDVYFEPRTQVHTIGISSAVMTYDLRKGFPLITTKNVPPRLPFEELFWKLRGERNAASLVKKNIHIWTANAFDRYLKQQGLKDEVPKHSDEWNKRFEDYTKRLANDPDFYESGDLGPVYGFQWRHWRKKGGIEGEVDQLANLLKGLKEKPGSRYHVLNAWNPGELSEMALGPCPFWHQFTIGEDRALDLTMVQRSNDFYLGAPFNAAQDGLLLELVAKEVGMKPRFFNYHTVNTHFYLGVDERGKWWENKENVSNFKRRFNDVKDKEGYLRLRDWYLGTVPAELRGDEGKDHMAYVLEQLSKEPKKSPQLQFKSDAPPLLEAIEKSPLDVVEVLGYEPHKWKSKAVMAA
jgi:thymidylate synthase